MTLHPNASQADHSLAGDGKRVGLACAATLAICCATTFVCFAVAGPALVSFLVSFVILTALLPPLSLIARTLRHRLLVAMCAFHAIALVWLIASLHRGIAFDELTRCYIVLLAFGLMLAGVAAALVRLSLAPPAASAITTVASLTWLSWPVWDAPYMSDTPAAARVIAVHPLFAVNGALIKLGVWSHLPFAYRQLMTLGQDLSYTLPISIWPAVSLHLFIAMAAMALSDWLARRRGWSQK